LTVLEAELMSEPEVRAGAHALSLFATPLNSLVLRALADGPMRLSELRASVGSAPQTTLRGHLGNLVEIGALARQGRDGSATAVDNELTPLGLELLQVADALEAWLAQAPNGPVTLDSERGKGAVKSLTGGWESTILRALAARPLSLTELDKLIHAYSYPALERRLSLMGATGQIKTLPSSGTRTLYAVTDWVRHAVAPLAVAGRAERRHMAAITAPITHVEVEAAFLLALPLVTLPRRAGGVCVLAVDTGIDDGPGPRIAGIRVEVERGEIIAFSEDIGQDPPSWGLGTANSWMNGVIDGGTDGLRIGGSDPALPRGLIRGIYTALFGK